MSGTTGQRIATARLALGLTQAQAAEIMGVTRPQIANIEADRSDCPAGKAFLLLDQAQVELEVATTGCWLAYYSDRSGFTVHPTELDALRAALGKGQYVKHLTWGEGL